LCLKEEGGGGRRRRRRKRGEKPFITAQHQQIILIKILVGFSTIFVLSSSSPLFLSLTLSLSFPYERE
jgi:hypothetical protein